MLMSRMEREGGGGVEKRLTGQLKKGHGKISGLCILFTMRWGGTEASNVENKYCLIF